MIRRVVVGKSAAFPQHVQPALCRTRKQVVSSIAAYLGGENNSALLDFAGVVYDDSVRLFNMGRVWVFARKSVEITLVPNQTVYGEADGFPGDFNEPEHMALLDASNNEVDGVEYIPWRSWQTVYPSQQDASGNIPHAYTIENAYALGTLRFEPKLGPTLTYPKVRMHYFRRVLPATGEDDCLDCPLEVAEAIYWDAVAEAIAKRRGAAEAAGYRVRAVAAAALADQKWRGWPDYFGKNE